MSGSGAELLDRHAGIIGSRFGFSRYPPDGDDKVVRNAASLHPDAARCAALFLTALIGWSGFLAVRSGDPAFWPGCKVAALYTALGILVPRWRAAARAARAEQRRALQDVYARMATQPVPLLPTPKHTTLALPTLAAPTDEFPALPLPVYDTDEATLAQVGLV